MNKIVVYDQYNFEGLSREFTSDIVNLADHNFNDCICSLKVIGNPWVAYTEANFSGEPSVFEEGEYPSVYYRRDFSSLELVTDDLHDPQITLYEEENYQGRSLVLTCESNLTYGDFNDTASSHKVQRGAWVLYQYKNRGGYIRVARAGRDLPKYGWFDNRLSHVYPLKAGKPTIKAEVDWDNKKECIKTITIDSITGVNKGSESRAFTTELCREYFETTTESFKFNLNSTQISWGARFEIDLCCFKMESNINVSKTFTVVRGSSNTKTTTKSSKISLPASIPPLTKLTANVLMEEVVFTVPVKLTITNDIHSKIEHGEYCCESGNSITVDYKEDKLQPHEA